MTIVGTRPEIIRLSRVLSLLHKHTELRLVHTGQNYDYELNQIFFDELDVPSPTIFLNAVGETAAITIGNIIAKVDSCLREEKPDAILILGDTNSCLAAITAKKHKIPIFHMEAGNRCYDQRVPEEINRRIVDHVSDINLAYSEQARTCLLREGLPPDRCIKTGSPMYEVLHHHMQGILSSKILDKLNLSPREYFIVSLHREENVDPEPNVQKIVRILNLLAEQYKKRVIVSTHPRTAKRFEAVGAVFSDKILLSKPFGFFDYVHLQKQAFAVLSDSGTISEEASILNFPALNLRETHERLEGMEEGAAIMTGLDSERILQGLDLLATQKQGDDRTIRIPNDYLVDNVSEKVLRIIYSYTNYVNRVVWGNSRELS